MRARGRLNSTPGNPNASLFPSQNVGVDETWFIGNPPLLPSSLLPR